MRTVILESEEKPMWLDHTKQEKRIVRYVIEDISTGQIIQSLSAIMRSLNFIHGIIEKF